MNARPQGSRPSCGGRESQAVLAALQEGVAARPELWGEVAVTGTSCLGPCFTGPTVVVYPEGVWYQGVSPGDVDEIIEQHLVRGVVVERLLADSDEDE